MPDKHWKEIELYLEEGAHYLLLLCLVRNTVWNYSRKKVNLSGNHPDRMGCKQVKDWEKESKYFQCFLSLFLAFSTYIPFWKRTGKKGQQFLYFLFLWALDYCSCFLARLVFSGTCMQLGARLQSLHWQNTLFLSRASQRSSILNNSMNACLKIVNQMWE